MNELSDTLNDLQTIRLQAHRLLNLARKNQSKHFVVHQENMSILADYVIAIIKERYPTLAIPYHSRWRHFEVGDVDRVQALKQKIDPKEQGRVLFELVILSVLLDAGAGSAWRYQDFLSQQIYSRSEGLALASFDLYASGAFSADPSNSFRADASVLVNFSETRFCQAFQVQESNPLIGVTGRVALLNRLGHILLQHSSYFGTESRLGYFYDYVISLADEKKQISTAQLFQAVLMAFALVWPKRLNQQGDVWRHSALKNTAEGSEYIPFHKLSQWLTYSLLEPLEEQGFQLTNLDALTALAEYRNGGLLLDIGLLQVRDSSVLQVPQNPGSEVVVEWRALTIALLDELATVIRTKLQKNVKSLPLATILQGGTWEAGRRLAQQKRKGGVPPIQIESDGTLF